ncbi:hypothetical protein [Mucilaginibacter sp.]|uniref:hypothetical protein n=1 Tax=Mucilaginibacter sp. TaxID=1882438 RepID=UPI00283D9D40|nr:hypothetical protein [Mucilaginibacter sp.]MDR3697542.1 hypothetical protein [Mucilaginibacter sp.]
MKILFICSSLEPGKDGVGDYTRRLASELIRQGHFSTAISLNDKYILNELKEVQRDDGTDLPVLRLPANLTMNERLNHAKKYIDEFDPDWLSLQFVIFGYHPKGLPYGFANKLAFLGTGRRWHIMFHEIWQGESKVAPLKYRIWGLLQKNIVKSIVDRIKPRYFTTSNNFYKHILAKSGIEADLLPVFSNIPLGNKSGVLLINKLPHEIIKNRKNYIIGSFFGEIHYDEYLSAAIDDLQQLVQQKGKQLVVTHIGELDRAERLWDKLKGLKKIYKYSFGRQSAQDIADYLAQIDIGLSTNPKILFQKSGGIAAMLNNNLPVILLRKNIEFDDRTIAYVKEIHEINHMDDFITQRRDFSNKYSVSRVAKTYMQALDIPLKLSV